MSTEDYLKVEWSDEPKFRSAAKELDAYISNEEKRFGVMIVRDRASRYESKIFMSFVDLRSALRKDKTETEEAYEYLKKSNRTMKKVIEKLHEEMKLCRDNILNEYVNFDKLNTDRLLSINPRSLTTSTARRK